MATKYWLLKTEPDGYSIDDLAAEPDQTTPWDGVRNYQARNMLRDDIRKGDRVLIYHSGGKEPAAVGTARVTQNGYPDPTQFDARSKYHDAKATRDKPRWYVVDVTFQTKFAAPVTLAAIRKKKSLASMELLRKGSRLSVQPVTKKEFETIEKMGTA